MKELLSTLGLCKRAGMLVVGEEPVEAAARAKDARVLLLAADAADNTVRRCRHFAEAGQCLWLKIPFTKAELGRATGRSVCAIAAITDIGFANSIVRRMAQESPEEYGEAARRLELKARRAAQRRAEQAAHEKNLRQGKKRIRAAPAAKQPEAAKGGRETPVSHGAAQPLKKNGKRVPAHAKHPRPGQPGRTPERRAGRARQIPGRGGGRPSAYPHSRPVKHGKGTFRKRDGS